MKEGIKLVIIAILGISGIILMLSSMFLYSIPIAIFGFAITIASLGLVKINVGVHTAWNLFTIGELKK